MVDFINGREVPPTIVVQDHVLCGTHQGSVVVEAGAFHLVGNLQGSLSLKPGVSCLITGAQAGSVHVSARVSVIVRGRIDGPMDVDRGGEVVLERGARFAGSLHNDGLVVVRGVFGGAQSGDGELRLEDGGSIKQPTRIVNGTTVYVW
jgi:cytoskeletal protein CcmA (bactofilin family)